MVALWRAARLRERSSGAREKVGPGQPQPQTQDETRQAQSVEADPLYEPVVVRQPYEGPAKWEFNIEFSSFVIALSDALRRRVPEDSSDRRKLAERAGLAPATLETLLGGSNPQLHTLWKLCQARKLRLSDLFRATEDSLTVVRSHSEGAAHHDNTAVH